MPVKIIEIADLAEDLVQVRDQLANDPANVRQEHRNCLATVQRQVQSRIAELDGYERLSAAQEHERAQLDDFENEVAALKEQVDESDKNILSVDMIKKAEEIEKLAHSVKERIKG